MGKDAFIRSIATHCAYDMSRTATSCAHYVTNCNLVCTLCHALQKTLHTAHAHCKTHCTLHTHTAIHTAHCTRTLQYTLHTAHAHCNTHSNILCTLHTMLQFVTYLTHSLLQCQSNKDLLIYVLQCCTRMCSYV